MATTIKKGGIWSPWVVTQIKGEKGDNGERLLPEDVYLKEIKTSLAKPLWLTHMLAEFDIKRTRFSKYGTEFKNMINHTEHDEIEHRYKEVV